MANDTAASTAVAPQPPQTTTTDPPPKDTIDVDLTNSPPSLKVPNYPGHRLFYDRPFAASYKESLTSTADWTAMSQKLLEARKLECTVLTQIDSIRPKSTLGLLKDPPDAEQPPQFDRVMDLQPPQQTPPPPTIAPPIDTSKAVASLWNTLHNCFLSPTDIFIKQYEFNAKAALMSQLATTQSSEKSADTTRELLASEPEPKAKSFEAAVTAKAREESDVAKRKFQSDSDSLKRKVEELEKCYAEEKAKRLKLDKKVQRLTQPAPKAPRGPAKGAAQTNSDGKETSAERTPRRPSKKQRQKNEPPKADVAELDGTDETPTNRDRRSNRKSKKKGSLKWRRTAPGEQS